MVLGVGRARSRSLAGDAVNVSASAPWVLRVIVMVKVTALTDPRVHE